jgi:beta-glucanase (GH16 family)
MGFNLVRLLRSMGVWSAVTLAIGALAFGCSDLSEQPSRSVLPAPAPAVLGAELLPPAPEGKRWELVWHDEFEGDSIDDSKWNVRADGPRAEGWWLPEAVELDGQGHLVMKVLERDGKFISGCIETRGKFERAFGYYVARIQLQSQPGHWSAFWLFNDGIYQVGDEAREGAEIDIMEKPRLDDRVEHAIHWDGYEDHHQYAKKVVEVPGIMEGFHTFALLWTPDEYVFYVNEQETWRTSAGGVCQVPLYIKLSGEVGRWGGDIREATLPDAFLVDYVRVYGLVETDTR